MRLFEAGDSWGLGVVAHPLKLAEKECSSSGVGSNREAGGERESEIEGRTVIFLSPVDA